MNTRERARVFWVELRQLRHRAPTVFYSILLIATAEVAMIFVAPLIVEDHLYLRLYLSSRAEAKTSDFAKDADPFLVVDPITGWRSRPNSQRGKWTLDKFGARATHPYEIRKTRVKRVMLLGNSLTNGGMHVENNETISAYLEDSSTECLNFATMLYSVDQMYLSYVNYLKPFEPDVVVVGIHGEPLDGLDNRYIPLWHRTEDNMPLFKPRFELDSDSLSLILPPTPTAYATILHQSDEFASLHESDRYYGRFSMYKRFGLLPFSSACWTLARKAGSLGELSQSLDEEEVKLCLSILRQLEREATNDGAFVVMLIFPDQTQAFPPTWRTLLPDRYNDLVSRLRSEGFCVVDARQFIRQSGLPPSEIYSQDGLHFTPLGNRVIAAAVKKVFPDAASVAAKELRTRDQGQP